MNIILLASDYNLNANIAIDHFLKNSLLKKYKIKVKGLIIASPYGIEKKSVEKMKKFAKKSGWRFSLINLLIQGWYQLKIKMGRFLVPNKYRQHFDLDELAQNNGIPFLKVADINDVKVKNLIKKEAPDYIVSCHLLQIIDQKILKLAKKGAINAHPSLIERHRGTFTAFWALFNKWKKSGVTVHFMTNEIDKGQIITKKSFRVKKGHTIHCINQKAAKLSAKLLIKSLIKLRKEEKSGYKIKKLGKYFSMPTKKKVENFYKKGKKLIKAKDLLTI